MSIRQGNKVLSAGQSLTQNLFDFKWADHILDDIQWLRADTFTWHDGRVYEAAYQHLLAEWNEVGDVPSTETIAGTQIYYRLAPDGHKICSASQEDEAVAIYEATGIAWYYILDTTNQRFKLPRTKFGFVGLRDNDVGKYITPGLPEVPEHVHPEEWPFSNDYVRTISPTVGATQTTGSTKSLTNTTPHVSYEDDGYITTGKASVRTSDIYGASTTVQSPATQMYLYFFVGNFAQSAVVNTAGINATLIDEIQGECIDLQNNKQDTATAVNYKNITNCITEIPQDIKLELNNGTLTLKAGSKVYVPDGFEQDGTTPKFYTITITSDNSATDEMTRTLWFGWNVEENKLVKCDGSQTGSPVASTYDYYYDSTTNMCYASISNGYVRSSLPFCVVKATSGSGITSISQVFNGFGYIGSTVFVLPGVKGLIPNGRNADGSLNNKSFTLTLPGIITMSSWMTGRNNAPLTIFDNGNLGGMDIDYTYWGTVHNLSQVASSYHYYSCWFCLEDNKMHYFNGSAEESISSRAFIGTFNVDSNNKITYLAPKMAYRAVDYSDAGFIAHQSMPSTTYINIPLPAINTEGTYIAPADGYMNLAVNANENAAYWILNKTCGYLGTHSWNGTGSQQKCRAFCPVSKGDQVVFNLSAGSYDYVRFYYANSSK